MSDLVIPPGYGRVVGRVLRAVTVETGPAPLVGARVTVRPSVARVTRDGDPTPLIMGDAIECTLDDNGFLLGPDGEQGVLLVATDADTRPAGWHWLVRVSAPSVVSYQWQVLVPEGVTTDMVSASSDPSTSGLPVLEWRAILADVWDAHSQVMDTARLVDQDRQWTTAARAGAEQAADRAETGRDQAVTARGVAEAAADAAETAATVAVTAKTLAEGFAGDAETARSETTTARDETVTARNQAVTAAAALQDTGWRNISSLVNAGFTGVTVYLRRSGSTVQIMISIPKQAFSGWPPSLVTLPVGFRARNFCYMPFYNYSETTLSQTAAFLFYNVGVRGTVNPYLVEGSYTWLTSDAFPTTLPGTPA